MESQINAIQQRRLTLQQAVQDLRQRFDRAGRHKRTLLRQFIKQTYNIDIGYVAYEEQLRQFIRKARDILPTVGVERANQIIEQGVQDYYQGADEDLKEQIDNPLIETDDLKIREFGAEIPIGDPADGRAYIAYDLRTVLNADLTIKSYDDVLRIFETIIRPLAQYHFNSKRDALLKPSYRYSIVSDSNQYMSTNYISDYQTSYDICDQLQEILLKNIENYEKQDQLGLMTWNGAQVRVFLIDFFKNPQQRIGAVYKSLTEAYEQFLILDTVARHNCVFISIYTAICYTANYKLLVDEQCRSENARQWKHRQGFGELFGRERLTQQDIYIIAKKIEINCILYNNIFEKIDHIQNDKDIEEKFPTIELLIKDGKHCIPIIRWSQISKIYPDKIDELREMYDLHKQEPKEETIENLEEQKCEIIRKKGKLTQKKNPKIAVLDFETYKLFVKNKIFKPIVYMSGLSWMKKIQKEEYEMCFEQFTGDQVENNEKQIVGNLQKFWEYIVTNIKQFHKYIFYAHCGGRFDINLLVRDVLCQDPRVMISQKATTEINGSWISFGVHIKGCYIEFRDSYKLFQSKLSDVTKSFCKQYQKTHLDHNVINDLMSKLNGITMKQILESQDEIDLHQRIRSFVKEAEAYHELDCKSLLEALLKLNELFIKKYEMDILNARTISGLAKKYYLNKLYDDNKYPIVKLTIPIDKFIRKSYKGGMNICMMYGFFTHKKIYYYDFNSHYPDVGCNPLPFGNPIYKSFENNKHTCNEQSKRFAQYGTKVLLEEMTEQQIQEYRYECSCFKGVSSSLFLKSPQIRGGFFEVLVRGGRGQIKCKMPYLSVKKDVLVYPFMKEIHQLVLTYPEIQYAQKLGYEIIIRRGFIQSVGKYFEQLFTQLYEQKKEARKDGDECLENLSKVMINSAYGWPGLNVNNKDQILFAPKNTSLHYKYMNEGKLVSLCDWQNNKVMRIQSDCQNVDCNVGISSYITAYARIKLHQLITTLQDLRYTVYYCDSDSIITDCKLSDHPELIAKYRPDNLNTPIYEKKQIFDKNGKHLRYESTKTDQLYKKISDCSLEMGSLKNELGLNEKGEDIGFDEIYMAGCKNYACLQKDFMKELMKDLQNKCIKFDEDEIYTDYDIKEQFPDIYKKYKMEQVNTYKINIQQFETIPQTEKEEAVKQHKDMIKKYLNENYIRGIYFSDDNYLQTDVLINQSIMQHLDLEWIYCYTYQPLMKKQRVKKLKGFKQVDSDVKLNMELYEKLLKGDPVEQQITMFNTPKFAFVREIIQLQGSGVEAFQMNQLDGHKKFTKTCNKGKIDDQTGQLIPYEY